MNHSGRRFGAVLAGGCARPRGDVELERMHELVADHMVGVAERTAHRQHDATPHRLGDAAGSFAELTLDCVGLLEIGMRGIQDERLPAAERVGEYPLEPRVPPFGHTRGDVDPVTLARVEVDVEVLGLEDLEIELLVLDFVAPEILLRASGCRRQQQESANACERCRSSRVLIHGARK